MSGFASSVILSGKVFAPPEVQPVEQEAAGKVGKVLGVIAAVVMPFAAPAIWGAIAGSTAIGASMAGAMTGMFGAGLTNVIGSALVGGIMNAGIAYASGARGGAVWSAFGTAALSTGLGRLAGGLRGAAGTTTGTAAGTNILGGTGPVSLVPGAVNTATASGAAGGLVQTTQSGGIISRIDSIFSNLPIDRIGTAIVNAIANGDSQERLDALMVEQRAALAGLNAQEQAAYAQRMQAAEQVLAAAGRMDPARVAYMRMGDVAGIMNREHDQALRNISVRQGGSLDAGQRNAYERSGRLEIGRRKAGAWGEAYQQAQQGQAQLYGQAAGLFTGPNYAGFQLGYGMEGDYQQATNRLARSTAGGFASIFNEKDYNRSTSPSPSDPRNNGEEEDPLASGMNWPNG